jgi:hypothetical protein
MMTTNSVKVLLSAALGLLLLGAMTVASAHLVTWQLKDVGFDDGGSITGFFTLDNGGLTNFDIKTMGGTSGIPPFEFTPESLKCREPGVCDEGTAAASANWLMLQHFLPRQEPDQPIQGDQALQLGFEQPLSDEGGTVSVHSKTSATGSFLSVQDYNNTIGYIRREVVSPVVTGTIIIPPPSVPEPSTCISLLLGIGVLLIRKLNSTPIKRDECSGHTCRRRIGHAL